jgi:hypothetical protein
MVGSFPGFSSIYPFMGPGAGDKKCGLVGGYRKKKNPFETSCWELTHILKIFVQKKGLETILQFTAN